MADIEDVLREMRWCQQYPIAQGWANVIEAAMREKDEVIAKLGNGYAEAGRVLDAKDAEIVRLEAEVQRLKAKNARICRLAEIDPEPSGPAP